MLHLCLRSDFTPALHVVLCCGWNMDEKLHSQFPSLNHSGSPSQLPSYIELTERGAELCGLSVNTLGMSATNALALRNSVGKLRYQV